MCKHMRILPHFRTSFATEILEQNEKKGISARVMSCMAEIRITVRVREVVTENTCIYIKCSSGFKMNYVQL